MSKVDPNKAAATAILIGFLVLVIIIIKLVLAWIQFNRFLFWIDIVLIPISFIGIVVAIIAYFADEWNRDDWLLIGGISLVVFIITLVTVNGAYNQGYSDETIKSKAELEKMLEDYTFILSVYTGEFRLRVEGMVMSELDKALCEAAPDRSCEQVIKMYNEYQDLVGWKESADTIHKIWK